MLDPGSGCLDLLGIRNIRGNRQSLSTELVDFAGGNMKAFGIPRNQSDMRSFARKGANGRTTHARRCPGNHNNSAGILFVHEVT